MSESLPTQTLLQQANARPVSGEDLEVFGKKAAARWRDGECKTLNEAVTETVKHAQLSPEQVRRVVEFCNQDAYLQEFTKGASDHRIVDFPGGPADPSIVLKDLNDGGGGSVFDRGTLDYKQPPPSIMKAASAPETDKTASALPFAEKVKSGTEGYHSERMLQVLQQLPAKVYTPEGVEKTSHYEGQLLEMLGGGTETPIPYENPVQPLQELYYKLGSARDQVSSEIDSAEIEYGEAGERLFQAVKEAAKQGTSLGDMIAAWDSATEADPSYVKVAFQLLTPRLRREVFSSYDALGESLEKIGSAHRLVNKGHPLISNFNEFCHSLSKLSSLRSLKQEFDDGFATVTTLLKKAAAPGGLVGKAWRGLGAAGEAVGKGVGKASEVALGTSPETTARVADIAKNVVQYGGAGTAGLAGMAAAQEITDRPAAQRAMGAYKSIIPGTAEYEMRRHLNRLGQ